LLDGDARADNLLAGTVVDVSFVGSRSTLQVRPDAAADIVLTMHRPSRPGGSGVAVGDAVRIGWSAGECSLLFGSGG
jgi:hypothetical protein